MSHDPSTDSLYLEPRPFPARRTVAEDVLLDLGEDGEPVGYDTQDASQREELVARLVLEEFPTAAE